MKSHHPPDDTKAPSARTEVLPTCQGTADVRRAVLESAHGDVDHALAAQLWQQAVHDLRGKLGVVTAVTSLLQKPRSDLRRLELIGVLDRNVAGLRDLLNGVADLARLETQQERPVICAIDIAKALQEMCNNLRVLASARGLRLEISGPASLVAESDPLMVARIAQNLVLNAIQYTRAAGVTVTYGYCDGADAEHWYFEVGDARGHLFDGDSLGSLHPTGARHPGTSAAGEGIGLSIVSRLCRLLGGTMSINSMGGTGRTTRIRLPKHYVSALEALTLSFAALGGSQGPGVPAPAAWQCLQRPQTPLPTKGDIDPLTRPLAPPS